ncbi:MAG: GIY-YIG nuclease family protein [Candidatus Dependentiae bacterium]|nr:GIY-YIG nuclease family protein [Candidatus Dependentiae bacterium]
MQDFYVYILRCNDDSYYIGHTDNIEIRFAEHQQRTYPCCYTATRLPVTLVFVQETSSRDEAFEAERQIKKWTRKKKKALIQGDISLLKNLSKNKLLVSKSPLRSDPFVTFLVPR